MAHRTTLRQVIWTGISMISVFLGLVDAPEQLAKLKRGWDVTINAIGVDWSAFWGGSYGRWLLVLVGLVLGLWAWDVPQRLLVRRRRQPFIAGDASEDESRAADLERRLDEGNFFIKTHQPDRVIDNLGKVLWRETDLDEAMERGYTKMSPTELSAAHDALIRERDVVRTEIQQRTNERDGITQALVTCKRNFALARLRWFSERARMKDADVRVTLRFAEYQDCGLAQQIEAILKEHTRWPVTLDGSNKPTIRPDSEFKVIFESGLTRTYDEVASAFSDGALVAVSVGVRSADRTDYNHLVIEVLPTIKP